MDVPAGLFKEFFSLAPVGCGVSDETGKLVAFNDAMLAYSGFTRTDIEAMSGVVDLYMDGPSERDRLLGIAREKGRLAREEVRFKKKDGGFFWAEMSLRPVEIEGRRFFLAIVEDVTLRKKAEQERLERVQELERITAMIVDREKRMLELKERIRKLEAGEA